MAEHPGRPLPFTHAIAAARRRAPRPRFDVTSVGESMLRLSVPAGTRFTTADHFDAHLGGAESNVCAALAGLGRRTGWVSSLPASPLGEWALRQLRAAKVDVEAVVMRPGERLGAYYAELSDAPRAPLVIYDRRDSAASHMGPAEVDWDYLLDTRLLHLTGITPALGEGPAALVEEAMRRANEAGVPVVFDVNYRGKLWAPEVARAWLEPRLASIDLLLCGASDAATVFGLRGEPTTVLGELAHRSRGGAAVLTLGGAGALAMEGADAEPLQVEAVAALVVDRLGAGDAFAAGILDGLLDGSLDEGMRRGAALAALALAQDGDMVWTDRAELAAVMAGSSARPSR